VKNRDGLGIVGKSGDATDRIPCFINPPNACAENLRKSVVSALISVRFSSLSISAGRVA
jgi:hypothetical protein